MASSSPSPSPRWDSAWDNRNSGFVSPSQLQQWKQHQQQQQHDPQAQPPSSTTAASAPSPEPSQLPPQSTMYRPTSRQNTAPAQGPSPPSKDPPPAHARTTSHFSFFSLKSKQHSTPQPSNIPSTLPRASSTPADEFGHPSNTASQPVQSPRSPLAVASDTPRPMTLVNGTPLSPNRPANGQPTSPLAAQTRRASTAGGPLATPELVNHPEIRSVLGLVLAQGRKIYFAGPLVQHDEREADGVRSKDDGWRDVWAQLGGTTLSLWDMKEIQEASKQNRQVPPKYVNIQDSFVAVLGSVTIPPTATAPSKRYTNVLTLNTAGVNLKLFACPSTQSLLAWTAALRLAAWEKSRLEEIYTAHLLRITLEDAARTPTTLVNGHLEQWVKVRIAGRTDWKGLWMVISAGLPGHTQDNGSISSLEQGQQPGQRPTHPPKKKRLSSLFTRDHSPPRVLTQAKPSIQLYISNKQKEMRRPLLTIKDVSQAFAVYPERPDLIEQASLLKLEGLLGDEEASGTMRNREAWILIMPESDTGHHQSPLVEMRKLLVAIHDAFGLYGRPRMYSWDPRDPRGMMFAYPIGEARDKLFLDRELAEGLDPRDDRTSANRSQLQHILWERMRGSPTSAPTSSNGDGPPRLPPISNMSLQEEGPEGSMSPISSSRYSSDQPMQLPPLNFEKSRTDYELPDIPSVATTANQRSLTPITENSDQAPHPQSQHSRSISIEQPSGPSPGAGGFGAPPPGSVQVPGPTQTGPPPPGPPPTSPLPTSPSQRSPPPTSPNGRPSDDAHGFLGEDISTSPMTTSPALSGLEAEMEKMRHSSQDSFSLLSSRPESKMSMSPGLRQATSPPPLAQSPPFNGSASRQQSLDKNRPESPPLKTPPFVERPLPTTRLSVSSIAKDTALPAIPQDVPQTPPHRHGVELHDPPTPSSPHFSVLTSPHSIMNSPVMDRTSRQSLMYEALHLHELDRVNNTSNMSSNQSASISSNPSSPIEPPAHTPLRSPALSAHVPDVFDHPHVASPRGVSPRVTSPAMGPRVASPAAMGPRTASPAAMGPRTASPAQPSPLHSPRLAHSPPAIPTGAPPPQASVQPPMQPPAQPPRSRSESEQGQVILREAGALYYMRHIEQGHPTGPRRALPMPDGLGDEPDSDSESGSSYSPSPMGNTPAIGATSPLRLIPSPNSASPPPTALAAPPPSSFVAPRGGTPVAFGPGSATHIAPSPEPAPVGMHPRMAAGPVRKPSGARAVPVSKTVAQQREHLQQPPHLQPPSDVDEEGSDERDMSDEHYDGEDAPALHQLPPRMAAAKAEDREYRDHHADAVDALAALNFLEREDAAQPPPPPPLAQQRSPIPPPPPIPSVVEPRATSPPAPAPADVAPRSSFAPSKQASQRRLQAQAQQAASQASMSRPGKSGRKKARDPGAWGDSSEEEDDEDDDDDDEVDSDAEPVDRSGRPGGQPMRGAGPQGGYAGSVRGVSPGGGLSAENIPYGQPRQRRDLPQVPGQGLQSTPGGSEESLGMRRSQYSGAPPRQPSPQMQRQLEPQSFGAARQNNIWSTTLDREKAEPVRDTFVQIEPPSQTMTKAFAPHGLLSAGLQDKADRSAKRQEELARETGSSLINVPNKPPPPQTGLLGAVTAHERERKREGGLGAALTEREREKRLAEERQRKLDEFQRMQLEQAQQGGSMYGGAPGMGMLPQFTGYNPMMAANPMMMGMNPMMTGWGYPGMMNPQHMFAAQQAAQAYQQAMMAMSAAGSQVGGGAEGAGGVQPGAQPMNPMLTGGMMGGYDPRMSMFGMPMMTGMSGMNPAMAGMNPAMGMGQGMGQGMAPMAQGQGMGVGMQMTGGTFDPRYSPGNDGAMRPMNELGGSQLPYSSQASSANGQGSPAGPRSQDPSDEQQRRMPDDVR